MKKKFVFLLFLFFPVFFFAQLSSNSSVKTGNIGKPANIQNNTVNPQITGSTIDDENLAIRKILSHKRAIVEDGIVMSAISIGKYNPKLSLKNLVAILKKNKVKIDSSIFMDKKKKISRGQVAKWIMTSLDLKGGVFFSLFKSERYSYQECVFKKIMAPGFPVNGSISGPTLVSAFALAQEQKKSIKLPVLPAIDSVKMQKVNSELNNTIKTEKNIIKKDSTSKEKK